MYFSIWAHCYLLYLSMDFGVGYKLQGASMTYRESNVLPFRGGNEVG